MSKYAGTQTEKNLETVFAGESQARNKYTYFASKAKKEGFEQIAALFLKTADNEKEHAKMWFKELAGIGSTAENLGAAIAVARRGGLSATFDELNKFFAISGMPVASSQYWNSVHGREPGQAAQDAEGLQTMRTLARNMTFLMRSTQLGKEKYGLPEREAPQRTNFIR